MMPSLDAKYQYTKRPPQPTLFSKCPVYGDPFNPVVFFSFRLTFGGSYIKFNPPPYAVQIRPEAHVLHL